MARPLGKTAGETVANIQAVFKRLVPQMRGSITLGKATEFARHVLPRGMLSATTYFRDAYARPSWPAGRAASSDRMKGLLAFHSEKGGIDNANGRTRRWLPRSTGLDELTDQDILEIAMTINLTTRKCLGYRTPVEAFLSVLGRDVEIRLA